MTNVIDFQPAERKRRASAATAQQAQILFFTGVRYERDLGPVDLAAHEGMLDLSAAPGSHMSKQDQTERKQA